MAKQTLSDWTDLKDVVGITANFKDFTAKWNTNIESTGERKVRCWQQAYFELLSWKNTWSIPYKMNMYSTYDHEPYVYLIVNDKQSDKTVSYLESLGYSPKVSKMKLRVFHPWDNDEIYAADEKEIYLEYYIDF